MLPVNHVDSCPLEREQNGEFDDVNPQRFVEKSELLEFALDFGGNPVGDSRIWIERTTKCRDTRTGTGLGAGLDRSVVRRVGVGIRFGRRGVEPGVVQLVVLRGGTEIPHDGVRISGHERKADRLVDCPGADVSG